MVGASPFDSVVRLALRVNYRIIGLALLIAGAVLLTASFIIRARRGERQIEDEGF
ncbi:MAG: hypothetical protein ACE5OY_00190 [Candidatus Bathyarchaeia archaeon]